MSAVPAALTLVIAGAIDTPTGGYRYDRRIVAELRGRGHEVEIVEVGGGFPLPSAADIAALTAALEPRSQGRVLLVDGLVFSAPGAAAALEALRRPMIALIHHPLALEAGLTPEAAAMLRTSELDALALGTAVVVTSPETRDLLVRDFAVGPERVAVALPGVDRPAIPTRSVRTTRHLLTVASFIPRKGYLDLVAALAHIAALDWQATFIGGMDFDPPHVRAVRDAIAAAGLGDRIRLIGEVDQAELETHYAAADVFVLATHYEGYGMAFAEAFVRGLGIIGTTGAAGVIDTGGDAVSPGDVAALAAALERAVATPEGLDRLRRMAAARAPGLPDWPSAGRVFSDCADRIAQTANATLPSPHAPGRA